MIGAAVRHLNETGGPDANQVLAYDLAHAASAAATARALLDYGAKGDTEARIACAFAADMVHDLITRLAGREQVWGVETAPLARRAPVPRDVPRPGRSSRRSPRRPGPRHLDADMELVQDTFRSFATNVVAPQAEHVHRTNGDVPEDVIEGLAEIGAFGLSVPAEYGGYSEGGDSEYLAHGRRHRGAQPGQPGHRRLADHPARDPHPCARQGRHRGSRSSTGCRSWPRPR